ncbi:protein-glutamine gamma-glutamyltransferase [Paenibacillus anaericanus]|uniref:Protein-glutamine gamma-glutamyltransferase n=1 Tax=Paenibacillus anaericanus TaxID=170367 RepID=A0A433Y727_9BACL|nr:protein-glutamine gamma-glutamyltransferase [Paenibacillus anaericanus]RUT45181.1 protein-glutamine gamma-glutamyltransferase [Paenibacillus anaericanus]
MIVTLNTGAEQVDKLDLTVEEKAILQAKKNSPIVYRYDSPEALKFELKMRTRIVEAAKALNSGGAQFARFKDSRCNERYWSRTDEGGFQLRPGVLPSDGINDIFANGSLYAFECATAIVIILYKAVLDMVGPTVFNQYFRDLLLWDWNYDKDLRLISTNNANEAYTGDVLYFQNPDHDPRTPEWQGENVVKLADDLYFGHGIGITTSEQILSALNSRRRPGSTTPAFLTDQVVHPDFDYLRKL